MTNHYNFFLEPEKSFSFEEDKSNFDFFKKEPSADKKKSKIQDILKCIFVLSGSLMMIGLFVAGNDFYKNMVKSSTLEPMKINGLETITYQDGDAKNIFIPKGTNMTCQTTNISEQGLYYCNASIPSSLGAPKKTIGMTFRLHVDEKYHTKSLVLLGMQD